MPVMLGRGNMPKALLDETDVMKMLNEINFSLKWRKSYEDKWDRTIGYLKGQFFDSFDDEDRICVNLIRPHVNVVIPAVYSKNPDVIVSPRKEIDNEDELCLKRAEIMQNLLRYYLKELDIKTEVKLCILDAIMTGLGWAKTAYSTEFENIEEVDKEDKITLVAKITKMFSGKSDDSNESDDEESELSYSDKIISESPWAMRVSPFDIIVPSLSRRETELGWITERIILPYEEVMEMEDFDVSGLKPSANANELLAKLRGGGYKKSPDGDGINFSILYERWNRDTQQVITLAEGHKKALQVKDSEYTFLDTNHHPYVSLRFGEITDEFYPQGDIEPAEPQIKELNEIRTQMTRHRKRYNRRYIARPGAFDEAAKADLKSGEDGTVIEHSNIYLEDPIGDLIEPIMDAPLPPEVYQIEARVKDDMFTILGTSDYASSTQQGARTATEASIIATQSRFKVEERIDQVGTFVGRIIRNIAMIAQKYMSADQVADILGDDSVYWKQLTSRRQIQGEFSYDVVYGSTTPIDRATELEKYMQFFGIVRDDPMYNQIKVRLELVRKNNYAYPESWLQPAVAQIIEKQRLAAVKTGALLGYPANALGMNPTAGGSVQSTGANKLPTGQPRGLPGDLGGAPAAAGGNGGTALA